MNFSAKTYAYILRETALLKKSPLPVFIAFFFPLLAWSVIALSLSNPAISRIPIVVVDKDESSLSRTLIRSLDATQAVRVALVTRNDGDAQREYQGGDAFIIISIPKDFTKEIRRGGSSELTVLSNGAQLLYSKIAYRAVATAIYAVSAGILIRRFEAQGMPAGQALARAVPVHTEIHGIGNPWYDYGIYLAPGMMFALLQMSASFSTLWLFRQHREHNAAIVLPPRGGIPSFVFGRGFPLFIANALAVLALFLVLFPCCGIPISGATPFLLLITLLFTFISMGMGALFSVAFSNLVTAMQLSLLINAPAFVFSGYTFPRWAMPAVVRLVSGLIPLTHFLDGVLPVLLFNTPTTTGLMPLSVFAVVFWGGTIAVIKMRRRALRAELQQAMKNENEAMNTT